MKSNLGHLETSSGAAGLVKALLCLAHRQVPPTIGVEVINPEIRCGEWNLELVTQPLPLRKSGKLTIGVNSFGFGGANAHVLVESPPPATVSADATTIETLPPLIVSARCEPALKAAASDLAEVIAQQSPADYYRTAYNAAFRRDWHERRAIVFGDTPQEIAARLASITAGEPRPPGVETVTALASERGLAFVYTGNGSQWVGMGRHLLDEEPVFRSTLVEVDALFHRAAGFSLLDEFTAVGDDDRYASTAIAQPALFALQVGITRLLAARGIRPAVVVGHSVGEVAAAWAAGALSLSDAVQVIYQRSRLQETTRGCGRMTALALGPQAAEALLAELGVGERVVVAGINSPGAVTIAGEGDSLAVVEAELVVRHVRHKRLDLDYAFHSSAMDGIAADIRGALTTLQLRSTKVPFCSTVSGTLMPGERLDAEYWWHNIRRPVLFASAINAIVDYNEYSINGVI
ncbi:MAG TPA: acyltransferase domain-containing protein, partial [Pirellulaceae bacterium]|nr:acyltransferase domain-containing protein [Pirellulaceae bacterium]